jgi:hypothetical protein
MHIESMCNHIPLHIYLSTSFFFHSLFFVGREFTNFFNSPDMKYIDYNRQQDCNKKNVEWKRAWKLISHSGIPKHNAWLWHYWFLPTFGSEFFIYSFLGAFFPEAMLVVFLWLRVRWSRLNGILVRWLHYILTIRKTFMRRKSKINFKKYQKIFRHIFKTELR